MRYAALFLFSCIFLHAAQREAETISSFSIPEFCACFKMPRREYAIAAESRVPHDGSCPARKLPLGLWQKIALELVDADTSVEHTLTDVKSLAAVDRGLSKLLATPMYFKGDQDKDWTPYKAEGKLKLKGVCFAQEMVQKLHAAHKRSSISIADEILCRESMRTAQKKHEATGSMMLRIAMRALIARNLIGFDHYTALSDGGVLVSANVAPLFADDGRMIDTGGVQLARIGANDTLDRTFDLSKKSADFAQTSIFKPMGINLIKQASTITDPELQIAVTRINPTLQRYICGDHQEVIFTHRIHLCEGDTIFIYDYLDYFS